MSEPTQHDPGSDRRYVATAVRHLLFDVCDETSSNLQLQTDLHRTVVCLHWRLAASTTKCVCAVNCCAEQNHAPKPVWPVGKINTDGIEFDLVGLIIPRAINKTTMSQQFGFIWKISTIKIPFSSDFSYWVIIHSFIHLIKFKCKVRKVLKITFIIIIIIMFLLHVIIGIIQSVLSPQ